MGIKEIVTIFLEKSEDLCQDPLKIVLKIFDPYEKLFRILLRKNICKKIHDIFFIKIREKIHGGNKNFTKNKQPLVRTRES